MELTNKQLIKIAETIRDQLKLLGNHRYGEVQRLIYTVSNHQGQLEMIRKALDKSIYKNWEAATRKLTHNAQRIIHDLPYAISELEHAIKNSQTKTPALRELYEELRQVQVEFGRLEYNHDEPALSVFTEPIELAGIFLGDFEIRLQIPQLAEMRNGNYLQVIALDPHPAATNDCVTHPHISEEYLCAGDASVPMQTALVNGRICDFFMLVRSVLETYNPSSPYVSLDEWDGSHRQAVGLTDDRFSPNFITVGNIVSANSAIAAGKKRVACLYQTERTITGNVPDCRTTAPVNCFKRCVFKHIRG